MNVELARARETAEDARRLKQQFVQNVSHELRTPLNIIVGFSEMMTVAPESYGDGGLPPAFRGDINEIYRSARHLQGLIDDVLDLAQIEARRMGLVKEKVDPAELVVEATDTARHLIESRGLTLRVSIHADPYGSPSWSGQRDGLPRVHVDRLRIRQVLLNLLNNAARFTEVGGVIVRTSRLEGEVVISVTDTGKLKRCTLHAQEFIRRFLQHILPRGFVKVRYYVFLCSGLRQRLAALRQQLSALSLDSSLAQGTGVRDYQTDDDNNSLSSSKLPVLCPACGQVMRRGPLILPNENGPP